MIWKISKKGKAGQNKIGNKGKFLSILNQNDFLVPDGIILDSDEYFKFIKVNGIEEKIEDLLSELNADNAAKISGEAKKLFEGLSFSKDFRKKLTEKLDENKNYAVRSSATKEDLEEHSFAGQYETYLNVSGMEEIEKKIISCYQSLFAETSLSYLANKEIKVDELAMAVVIQEMVQADYSGICFTINPLTGNDKQMVLEVGKGLGEQVVSGHVKPEQYYYDWYEERVSFDEKNTFLTEEQVKQISSVFTRIMLLFGYPCDIEFAIKEGELFILQSRRITKINYNGIEDIWTTADFKDGGVSASTCLPYMWSLYEYIWEYSLRKFMLDSKILSKKETEKKLGDMFFARCYWNLSVVKLAMSKVIGYKEREFDSEYGVRITYEGDGDKTSVTPSSVTNIVKMYFAQKKILSEREDNAEFYLQDLLYKYNMYREKYDSKQIGNIEKVWYHLTKKSYLRSETTYFWQIFINTIHQTLYKDSLLKYVNESEYLTLLGTIDDISHMRPFYAMWNISREIRKDVESYGFWSQKNVADIMGETLENRYFLGEVKKIVEEYGYHSDKELDVSYPCYYEDPTPIYENIKNMVLLEDEFSPLEDRKKGKKEYQSLLRKIYHKEGKRTYQKVFEKIKKMRKMLWWREEYRDISTRFYYLIRIYTLELSKHFVKKGILKETEDIWFLRVTDIWDFLDKKIDKEELAVKIEKNKRYYYAYANFMSENEIGGVFTSGESGDDDTKEEGIKGLGANSGIITGTARVIEDFSKIDRLKENDILVTRFTDTGWTPKFAIISGIVTEYGGILCHAAIVSREYGIPAIVSCHDAMKKIKDGQTITIDGATGEVRIESDS